MEEGHAAQDAGILAALAVALLLEEIGEQGIDIVVDLGAVGMPGQKDLVLRRKIGAAVQQLGAVPQKLLAAEQRLGGSIPLQGGHFRLQRIGHFQNVTDHARVAPFWCSRSS